MMIMQFRRILTLQSEILVILECIVITLRPSSWSSYVHPSICNCSHIYHNSCCLYKNIQMHQTENCWTIHISIFDHLQSFYFDRKSDCLNHRILCLFNFCLSFLCLTVLIGSQWSSTNFCKCFNIVFVPFDHSCSFLDLSMKYIRDLLKIQILFVQELSLIDWLIDWCLTSSEQFFSYIEDENIKKFKRHGTRNKERWSVGTDNLASATGLLWITPHEHNELSDFFQSWNIKRIVHGLLYNPFAWTVL